MLRAPLAPLVTSLVLLAAPALAHDDAPAPGPSRVGGPEDIGGEAIPPAPSTRKQTLGLELTLGGAARVGTPDSGIDISGRGGLVYGLGAVWSPTRTFDFTLGWQRTTLGTEDLAPTGTFASARIQRAVEAAWLGVRAFPVRGEKSALFLGLAAGPGWERSSASVYLPPTTSASAGTTRQCSGTGSASLALAASVGGEFAIERHWALVTAVTGSTYGSSSDLVDGCFPGVGSAVALDARLGLAWKFDVGPAFDAK